MANLCLVSTYLADIEETFAPTPDRKAMLNQQFELTQSQDRKTKTCNPLVLVVDDNEDNILYACCSLELYECQHIVAYSAEEALDLARDRIPDLILMDIVMPKVDGMSVTRILKSSLVTSGIPIVAVTGLALPQQREQILNAGFDDYLCKPYYIDDLAEKLSLFIDRFL